MTIKIRSVDINSVKKTKINIDKHKSYNIIFSKIR